MPWLCRVLSCLILDKSQNLSDSVSSSIEWADHKTCAQGLRTLSACTRWELSPLSTPCTSAIINKTLSFSKSWDSPRPGPRQETLLGGGKRS